MIGLGFVTVETDREYMVFIIPSTFGYVKEKLFSELEKARTEIV